MRNGGTVLFDTRDQYSPLGQSCRRAPTHERLRQILDKYRRAAAGARAGRPCADSRSFYLLSDFPRPL